MPILKPIEHKFKALFFNLLKGTLNKRKPIIEALDVSNIKRVLFFRQDRLGDMVITLPIVDGLKKSFPHIDVSIMASPKNVPLIENDTRFEKVFLYTKKLDKDFLTIREIKKQKYDVVIDTLFDDSVTGLFLSQYCSNGFPIIGVGKKKYREYYDYCYDNESEHLIANMLKILSAFGIDPSTISGYGGPYLSEKKINAANEFISSIAVGQNDGMVIGLNLSSGARTRVWQNEKWIELIRLILSERQNGQVLLIATPDDRHKAIKIKKQFEDRVHIVRDNLDIVGVSAFIKKLDLLISPDTSLVHIARGYQIPVLGIYTRNERNFGIWHPYKMEHGTVRSIAEDNIFDITVEQVFDKFQELTSSKQGVSQ